MQTGTAKNAQKSGARAVKKATETPSSAVLPLVAAAAIRYDLYDDFLLILLDIFINQHRGGQKAYPVKTVLFQNVD